MEEISQHILYILYSFIAFIILAIAQLWYLFSNIDEKLSIIYNIQQNKVVPSFITISILHLLLAIFICFRSIIALG